MCPRVDRQHAFAHGKTARGMVDAKMKSGIEMMMRDVRLRFRSRPCSGLLILILILMLDAGC